MFERFTAKARRSLVLAQEEAAGLGHGFVGTEHVLLGLVAEGEGVAARVLADMGFLLDDLRAAVAASSTPPDDVSKKKKRAIPFTPKAKHALELSLREALTLGHNYIGTEHILLGLLDEGEGLAAKLILERVGSEAAVRERVLAALRGYGDAAAGGAVAGGASPRARGRSEHTPAAEAIVSKAEQVANGEPVGSHHLLLGVVDEPDCLAARALTSMGITRDALIERFRAIGAAGTTDEVPEPEPFTVHAFEGGITIRIDDPALAEKVRSGELAVSFKPPA